MNRDKILHGSINAAIIIIGTLAGLAVSDSSLLPAEYASWIGLGLAAAAMLLACGLHEHLRACATRKSQLSDLARAFTRLDIPLSVLYDALYPTYDARPGDYLSWRLQYIDRNGGVLHVLEMIKLGQLPEIRRVSAEAGEAILKVLPEVFGNFEDTEEATQSV